TEQGHRVVMVKCCGRPPEPPVLAAVRIEVRHRAAKAWRLVLRLERPEFRNLFNRLVEDLDLACRERPDAPCEAIVDRLARWQKLFSRGVSGVLSDNELRGLAGELSFLVDQAIPVFGVRAAVQAWVGPRGAPKDFVFAQREVEVKAVHRQRHTAVISSLEQLTDAGLPVFLWTQEVELLTDGGSDGISFAQLVTRARSATLGVPGSQELLEDSLWLAGFEDRPEYDKRFLRLGSVACYSVRTGFPRLQRTDLPRQILTCKYEIDLDEVGEFLVDNWK
ncbi:MAG: PD-(D/E)XK motif protein, partial [Fimbriimonadaceae bacterium]|nr:PD-(D/E)XK motif protein [Fimbriimonadaceae bacterium]